MIKVGEWYYKIKPTSEETGDPKKWKFCRCLFLGVKYEYNTRNNEHYLDIEHYQCGNCKRWYRRKNW